MIFFIAFSVLYIVFLLWVHSRWNQVPSPSSDRSGRFNTFSIILPVRNEADNIQSLLKDLARQDYPKDHFEVVVVDDNSEDGTLELAKGYLSSIDLNYRLIALSDYSLEGKKQAITKGVSSSRMQCILTTDGDCRVGSGWISAYNGAYQGRDAAMITGPVKMEYNNLFTHLQAAEFSGLIMIGAASLQSGNPSMCNGANLSYRRDIFNQVNGYQGNDQIPSGDDEFLLQKVFKEFGERVFFLKNREAMVSTSAKPSFVSLLNQRIRWSSKWKFHKSLFIKLLALFVFLNYVALFAGAVEGLSSGHLLVFMAVFIMRWLALWFFSRSITQFFGITSVLGVSLLIEIIYPFFVTFLGIASIFGKYSWKGRYYL